MSDVRQKILEILRQGDVFLAALATKTEEGAPWVRHVMGTIDDDIGIRIATSLHSRKVAHVRAHPEVHLVCGNTDPSVDAPFFQIEGRAEVCTEAEEKRAAWRESLAFFFESPENPDWCILRVRPDRITVHSMRSMETEVWSP